MKVYCWGCGSGENHYYQRRSRKKDPYLCPRAVREPLGMAGHFPGYAYYECECICIKPKKIAELTADKEDA